jgi:histidine triad (HIT) family protein
MNECLFCKIINGTIPAEKVFENSKVIGFKDLYPQAKEHYLFIHKTHTTNINDTEGVMVAEIFSAIKEFTSQQLEKTGFRVVTNLGTDAGQTVFHTHFHVLGGETLRGFGA